MSFWPLARTITDHLEAASARGRVVELGSGGGHFLQRLKQISIPCWGLDKLYPPSPQGFVCVAGDVLHLPFEERSISALLLPNVLRQIDANLRPRLAIECKRVLERDGLLIVLEDEPEARNRAEENYRSCLRLLGNLMPERGAGTLDAAASEDTFCESSGVVLARGIEENCEPMRDPMAPIRWMRALGVEGEAVESLAESIQSAGALYGRYWYRIFGLNTEPSQ